MDKKISPPNNKMKDLGEHCYHLSFLIGNLEWQWSGPSLTRVSDWLHIASGITSIGFDSARFDHGSVYCGSASDYNEAKSAIMSDLVLELARFNFIWGGLEILVDSLKTEDHPKHKGKINRACYLLKTRYEPASPLPFYSDLVSILRDLICQLPHYDSLEKDVSKSLNDRFAIQSHVGISGIGLFVVYRIRNGFAHGTLCFPEPEDYSWVKPLDVQLTKISSRLVLLSMQMMVLAFLEEETFVIPFSWVGDERIQDREVREALRTIHVKPEEWAEGQLSLFPRKMCFNILTTRNNEG